MKRFDSSDILLILANCVPLVGVLFFDWTFFSLMMAYWTETGVILFYTLVKVAILSWKTKRYKILVDGFGMVQSFGFFMIIHLVFIVMMSQMASSMAWDTLYHLTTRSLKEMFIMIICLVVSHGYSLIYHFIIGGEADHMIASMSIGQMNKVGDTLTRGAGARIVITQVLIILGMIVLFSTKSPTLVALLFVVIKMVIDLLFHQKKHRTFRVVPRTTSVAC